MPSLVLSSSVANGIVTGQNAYTRLSGNMTPNPLAIPSNIVMTAVRPSFATLGRKTIVAGVFSRPMVYDQFQQFLPAGIAAPTQSPVLINGTGSGGTGSQGTPIAAFGYLTFRQKVGNFIVQESNPTEPSNIIQANGTGAIWSNIPPSALDARVTHVVGYKSFGGSLAAQCWERPIGVTVVSENVLDANLGETLLALPPDPSGNVLPNTTARGVPPYCKFVEAYNFAVAYAGDPDHPERIYLSSQNEAESVDTVSSRGFLSTIDGDPVTGIRRWQNSLIVGTSQGFYAITGFSFSDYQIVRLGNYFNCLSNAAMVRIGQNEDLWFLSQEGPCMFNGTFNPMYRDIASYWRDVLYGQNRAGCENAIAVEDRNFKGYKCLIPQPDTTSLYLYGHYEPVARGLQPKWSFDKRNRTDSTIGTVSSPNSQFNDDMVTGSCDGYLRKENVATDASDDGDTFLKTFDWQSKHLFMGDQNGDDGLGRTYTDLDVNIMCENQPATISLYGGDDQAYLAAQPQWQRTLAATAAIDPVTGKPKVPKTSTHFGGLSQISGKGVTLRITIPSPVGVQHRGFQVSHKEGPQDRPST